MIDTTVAMSRRSGATLVAASFLSGLARSVLLSLAALLLWAAAPAAWGWIPTTVMSDSMAPLIRTGDVIVSMPIDPADLTWGRDVLVKDPDHPGRQRLHRFVGFDEQGAMITKGDANPTEDSSHVPVSDLIGIAVVRVPLIGSPIVWMRDGMIMPLGMAAAGVAALVGLVSVGRRVDDLVRTGSARRRAAGRASHPALAAFGLTALAAATTAGLLLGVATPAHAAFFSASPNGQSSLGAASAYDCLSPATPDSPFLLYRFSEVSGTSAADSSGNGRAGTLQGSITREAGNCTPGGSPAIAMSGSTAYVSTPTSVASPNTLTVEVWFKTTSASGGRLIGFGNAQTGTSSNTDRQIYMTTAGKVLFGAAPGGTRTTVASANSYNDGAWHLASATLGSSGMRLYVDGTLVASNTQVTSGRNQTGYWRVGGDTLTNWTNAPASTVLAGSIGGAGVYASVLSQSQIQAHFNTGQ